jgi:hypothetical protein
LATPFDIIPQILSGNFSQIIISGAAGAIGAINTYLLSPFVAGVRIDTTSYKEIYEKDISEQVIINGAEGKLYQTDNQAPRPRKWEITGYLDNGGLALTALSIFAQPLLLVQKAALRTAWKSREPIDFVPINKEELNNPITGALQVGIEHMEMSYVPETQNTVPITLSLKEMPVLSLLSITSTDNATPSSIINSASSEVDVGTASVLGGVLNLPGVF